ncbi:MAG: SWIM zinc finger family protein [Anaerolineaceae bacterium]|nr:SWIM zinc finger family protein [Anaerolineaceae bacterium]
MTTTSTKISKSEIFTVYNQMRAFARKHGNIKMIERLNKALGILQSKDYYQAEKALYAPTAHTCGCKDWQFRFAHKRAYTGACKHILAEIMLEQIKLNRSL